MKYINPRVSFLFIFCLSSTSAMGILKFGEEFHRLSVAGGVAHPSSTAAVYQNPAGIAYNEQFKGVIEGFTARDFATPGGGGGFAFGNGRFGGHLGGQVSKPSGSDPGGALVYGVGVFIPQAMFSLGLGGSTSFGNGASLTDMNLGMIFNAYGNIRVGATAYNLRGGIDSFGAGVAIDIGSSAVLVGDVASSTSFDAFRVKPGVMVGTQDVALTVSYGADIGQGSVSGGFSDGISAGLNVGLKKSIAWQIYFNQVSWLFTQVSIPF